MNLCSSTACTGTTEALRLRHWRGSWWTWHTSHWVELENRAVRSLLYAFTEHASYMDGNNAKPWLPNRRKIGDLLEALSAIVILADDIASALLD